MYKTVIFLKEKNKQKKNSRKSSISILHNLAADDIPESGQAIR